MRVLGWQGQYTGNKKQEEYLISSLEDFGQLMIELEGDRSSEMNMVIDDWVRERMIKRGRDGSWWQSWLCWSLAGRMSVEGVARKTSQGDMSNIGWGWERSRNVRRRIRTREEEKKGRKVEWGWSKSRTQPWRRVFQMSWIEVGQERVRKWSGHTGVNWVAPSEEQNNNNKQTTQYCSRICHIGFEPSPSTVVGPSFHFGGPVGLLVSGSSSHPHL